MQHDFSQVGELNYVSVPAGTHFCRVAEIRTGQARDGSERWSLRLEVVGGEWSGKTAAWDSITWSQRGVYRVKRVLECLGFDVSGPLEVEPHELVGRTAEVQVEVEEWEDPSGGPRRVRTVVPFLGYARADAPPAGADAPTARDLRSPGAENGTFDPFGVD